MTEKRSPSYCRDNVKFQNGKILTSKDVKYTFDELFKNKGYKAGAFYDTVPLTGASNTASNSNSGNSNSTSNSNSNGNTAIAPPPTKQVEHIVSMDTPDDKTIVFTVSRPSLANNLLSNFVAIPIIPEGTSDQQKTQPVGSGPFKFVSFDASQNIVELAANPDYWEGAPKIKKLRVKTVTDASSLQAELQTGGVDLSLLIRPICRRTCFDLARQDAQPASSMQFDGSNIQYLVFNTQSAPLNNVKVRQAIGYAIDRQKIVSRTSVRTGKDRELDIAAAIVGLFAGHGVYLRSGKG